MDATAERGGRSGRRREKRRTRPHPVIRELEASWAFGVEKARRLGRVGTLWDRIDADGIYWRRHAPHGMPRRFFERHFRACFEDAVLAGDPGFFSVMERASALLVLCWVGSGGGMRDRAPVPDPREDQRPAKPGKRGRGRSPGVDVTV